MDDLDFSAKPKEPAAAAPAKPAAPLPGAASAGGVQIHPGRTVTLAPKVNRRSVFQVELHFCNEIFFAFRLFDQLA